MKCNEIDQYVFPIIIGQLEAQVISILLEGLEVVRPLTHQLIYKILEEAELKIDKVEIVDFKQGIFYSNLSLKGEFKNIKLDARPSDSIALAIQANSKIYIKEQLLKEICIPMEDNLLEESPKEIEKPLNLVELEKQLQSAIEKEDYEVAANLRDQIEKFKNK